MLDRERRRQMQHNAHTQFDDEPSDPTEPALEPRMPFTTHEAAHKMILLQLPPSRRAAL